MLRLSIVTPVLFHRAQELTLTDRIYDEQDSMIPLI
jgi:hypothetical protein